MTKRRILVVDDESAHRLMLKAHLEAAGFDTLPAASGEEALQLAQAQPPDLVLLDLKMPGLSGLETLERLKDAGAVAPVIIMTAFGDIDSAVRALKLGAEDYLTKPLDTDHLVLKIEKILKLRDLEDIQVKREEKLELKFDFGQIMGRSDAMLTLKETLALVAPSEATVLITGESGTGKELVARAIHQNSFRYNAAFVAVNCAALPENLLESELFGHEKGAFTGAVQRKAGRFELAHNGTLFLDEIGEMDQSIQAKLLRALEEQRFERVGGTQTLEVDVRVLAATNRDLEAEIENGRFREDLFYRLNVVQVHVPALRERGPDDITLLADHFLAGAAKRNRKSIKGFRPRTVKLMTSYPWPGNVRELVNAVERSVILARGEQIEVEDLPLAIQSWSESRGRGPEGTPPNVSAGMTLKQVEAELIQRTLAEVDGNRSKAASMLGITRQTLLNKIREYHIGE